MRLPIETWILETSLPDESGVAFVEAVTAFKAGAYRAALLFSYLGWGLTLRSRLLSTPGPPSGMQAGQWQAIAKDLRDDDRWDARVFECTQMQSPAAVFVVSEDIRTQVRYWKDRRNDCAHFKLNEIGSPHVESFWAFVRSNIGRFVPLGSEAALVAAFHRHFDPNVTPPDADVAPLVQRVNDSMRSDRFGAFLQDLRDSLVTSLGKVTLPRSAEFTVVLSAALRSGGRLGAAALQQMLEDPTLLLGVLRAWPEGAGYLSDYPEKLRQLWKTALFEKGHPDLQVYAALLRNGLIPAEQIPEANDRAARNLQGDVPQEVDVEMLSRSGFIERVKQYAFEENLIDRFSWGNTNAAIVTWYVERFPLDDVVVSSICDTFGAPPYPFAAEAALKQLFATNPPKNQELKTVAKRLGKDVPPSFSDDGAVS